jgi:hypothetical protein
VIPFRTWATRAKMQDNDRSAGNFAEQDIGHL